jgi:hypothetical protein
MFVFRAKFWLVNFTAVGIFVQNVVEGIEGIADQYLDLPNMRYASSIWKFLFRQYSYYVSKFRFGFGQFKIVFLGFVVVVKSSTISIFLLAVVSRNCHQNLLLFP